MVTSRKDIPLPPVEVELLQDEKGYTFKGTYAGGTALGHGPTPRRAYYDFMDTNRHLERERDAFYVKMCVDRKDDKALADLLPGEEDRPMGMYGKAAISQPDL